MYIDTHKKFTLNGRSAISVAPRNTFHLPTLKTMLILKNWYRFRPVL